MKGQLRPFSRHGTISHSSNEAKDDTKSTRNYAHNMKPMGRKQEIVRHFETSHIASFLTIAMASWEIRVFEIGAALTNGGRPALPFIKDQLCLAMLAT